MRVSDGAMRDRHAPRAAGMQCTTTLPIGSVERPRTLERSALTSHGPADAGGERPTHRRTGAPAHRARQPSAYQASATSNSTFGVAALQIG